MIKNTTKFRIFLYLAIFAGVFFFLLKGVVPGGEITYQTNFQDNNFFISQLSPKERLDSENKNQIIADPVYFSLWTPRSFDKATISLKYKRNGTSSELNETPIIEMGPLVDARAWRYKTNPLENRILDQLSLIWDVERDGDMLLIQKNKHFESVEEFIDSEILPQKVALYNYDLKKEYLIKDYSKKDAKIVIDSPLQGAYQFYTYVKKENLTFNFDFIDLNKNKDPDPIDLFLYYEDKLLDSRHLDDDGDSEDKGNQGEVRSLGFDLAGMPEGVYKIELKANDDIVTSKITSPLQKLSFLNRIRFAHSPSSNIKMFTDSKQIQANTIHPDKLQIIKVGTSELELEKTYTQFSTKISREILEVDDEVGEDEESVQLSPYSEIQMPKSGIILSGNGIFSFSEDAIINPKIAKVDVNLDIKAGVIDFILANYPDPNKQDGFTEVVSEFEISGAYREDNKYSFLISIPGLDPGKASSSIEIMDMKVELKGRSLFEKVFKK